MARKLIVEIIGDASALEKSYRQAGKATNKFGKDVERAGRGATAATIGFQGLGRSVGFASGAFLGGAGFAVAVKSSVEAASNLNEQLSKTRQVFGLSAGAVEEWSKTTVTSMGLAQDQALETASSFGALLRPIGLTGDAAAEQSQRLTKLGADLASFYNTDVQSALDAIRSGLVGESEPLRRYGVLLSEARVQQEALAETGKASAKQLTDQDKVLARIALTFKDSGQAQGDFARTSDGFANQTRILKANIRQLEIELGQGLIPVLTRLVAFINTKVIPVLGDLKDAFDALPKWSTHKGLFEITTGSKDPALDLFRAARDGLVGVKEAADDARFAVGAFVHDIGQGPFGSTRSPLLPRQYVNPLPPDPFADARPAPGTAATNAAGLRKARAAARTRAARLVELRNTIFDNKVARAITRAQYLPTLRAQIAALRDVASLIQQRIAVTKDATRRATLEDQRLSVLYTIQADQAQIAGKIAEAAKKRAAAEKKRAAAEKEAFKAARERVAALDKARRERGQAALEGFRAEKAAQRAREMTRQQARVFGLIGLTATGEERAPSRGNLQAALRKAQAAIAGTPLDTKGLRSRLGQLRVVLNSEFGKLTRDTKIRVAEFLDALTGKDKTGPATKYRTLDVSKITRGLDRPTALTVQSRLSAAHIVVENHVHLDGKTVARSVTSHQVARNQREPTQVRGRQTR